MNLKIRAKELRQSIEANLKATRSMIRVDELTEQELSDLVDLYPEYKTDYEYSKVGEIIKYEGSLYEIRQVHTSQSDWKPNELPALYRLVQPADVVAEWDPDRDLAANPIQPGERVIWTDGKVYESIHPTPHAWSPADYPAAWKLAEQYAQDE